jgi:hypothetical protein
MTFSIIAFWVANLHVGIGHPNQLGLNMKILSATAIASGLAPNVMHLQFAMMSIGDGKAEDRPGFRLSTARAQLFTLACQDR